MSDKREKPETCDSCDYETKKLKWYESPGSQNVEAWLCEVCAGTLAGNAYHNPRQYDNAPIMKQISYCTNLILDAIKTSKK